MKRHVLFTVLLAGLFLVSCQNPEKSRVAYDQGIRMMYNQSKFAEAEQQFTKAIKYDKTNYEAYYYRGCTKFNRAMYDEALEDFNLALQVKPDYADAEFVIGRVYLLRFDFEKACEHFTRAQELGRPNLEDEIKNACNR